MNTKALTPELVDLKITNQCLENCRFCYQNSTRDGDHAPFDRVEKVLKALARLKVFEVAIGGGEPTSHPDFVKICKTARSLDIVPNFSTRDIKWITDTTRSIPIISTVGGFAVSISWARQVQSLHDLLAISRFQVGKCNEKRGFSVPFVPDPKASVQVILGCGEWAKKDEVEELLALAYQFDIPVTFLGFKKVGRAKDLRPEPYPWFIELIAQAKEKYRCPRIGLDTVLANELEPHLDKLGIDKRLYHTREGLVSCYIDAVEGYMSVSSYDNTVMDILDFDRKPDLLAARISEFFARY